MSLPVVLRPEANRDAEEARDYLEAQRAGLGQAFLDRLDEVLGRIRASGQNRAATVRERLQV